MARSSKPKAETEAEKEVAKEPEVAEVAGPTPTEDAAEATSEATEEPQVAEEVEKPEETPAPEKAPEPEPETGEGKTEDDEYTIASVIGANNSTVRKYELAVHGDGFRDLAEEYARNRGFRVVYC